MFSQFFYRFTLLQIILKSNEAGSIFNQVLQWYCLSFYFMCTYNFMYSKNVSSIASQVLFVLWWGIFRLYLRQGWNPLSKLSVKKKYWYRLPVVKMSYRWCLSITGRFYIQDYKLPFKLVASNKFQLLVTD